MNHLQVMIKLDIQERRWRKHEKLSYLYVFVDNPWKDTGYPGANSLDDPNLGIAALARSFDHYWPSLLLQISKELWGAVEQPKYDLLWHIHILLHGGFLPWGKRSNLSWPTNMGWNCSPRGFIEESGPFVRRQYVSQEWGPCSAIGKQKYFHWGLFRLSGWIQHISLTTRRGKSLRRRKKSQTSKKNQETTQSSETEYYLQTSPHHR